MSMFIPSLSSILFRIQLKDESYCIYINIKEEPSSSYIYCNHIKIK